MTKPMLTYNPSYDIRVWMLHAFHSLRMTHDGASVAYIYLSLQQEIPTEISASFEPDLRFSGDFEYY